MKYVLFPVDTLPPGSMRSVDAGGVTVVVIHAGNGTFHALRDVCSHQGARLSDGCLEAAVVAGPDGSYEFAADREVVRCPWHWYEFDIESGRSLADPKRNRVRAYRVSIEDGMVTIER